MRTFAPGIALFVALGWIYGHLFRGELLAGRDVLRLAYPDAHFLLRCLQHGELPLWIPNVFLGQPFAATLQAQAFYPPRVLFAVLFGPYWGVSLLQVFHAAVAALGAHLALRALGRSRWAARLGAMAFGLSPLFTELSGTPNLVSATAWSGWIVWAAVRAVRGRASAGHWLALARDRMIPLGAFVALPVLAGAPETVLWQALFALAVAIPLGGTRALRLTGGWLGGALLSAVVWLPALELAFHSSRSEGKGSHLDWSASWPQLAALFWPHADQPRGAYWAEDQWLILQLFLGTAVAALAVFALGRVRPAPAQPSGGRPSRRSRSSRIRWAIGLVVLALLVLSLGRHLAAAEAVLSLPGLRTFRYPAKALIGAAFGISLLAAFGLDRARAFVRRRRVTQRGALLGAVAVIGAVAVVAAFAHGFEWRAGVQRGAPWVSVTLVAAWALVSAWPPGPRRSQRVGIALFVLCALELVIFQARFVGTSLARAETLRTPSALAALAGSGRVSVDYRPPPSSVERAAPEAEPIEVTRGRDAFAEVSRKFAVPNRFVEDGLHALEGYGAPEPPRIQQFQLARSRAIADLSGVTLFVRADTLAFPDLEDVTPDPAGPRVGRSGTAYPRAWMVHEARVVSDEEALAAVLAPDRRTLTTAYLAEGEPLEGPGCEGSSAELTRAGADLLEVEVSACGDGYLVLSDAFFPGWEASVDGSTAEVLRAQYALRAIRVPKGAHRVELRYRPVTFAIGSSLTLLSLLGAAAALRFRRERTAPAR